ncbi:MAG: polyphosphate kinase 2 family protein [Candidatus Omnitrophica bacterium]|nr:polyphosphate kinase 2 family protein [Candidatus Omnitrophota bacterium]MDE2221452.1 polyphosphate kinase 2 family protein [Candidatus Omnitrophota bacterium]
MSIKYRSFRVDSSREVDLKRYPTLIKPFYRSKEEYAALLSSHTEELSRLQDVFYAYGRYALLLVFQAMDAAGKDSAVKHVMSGVNPQGCQVFSFKAPSTEELKHDFLWRGARALPERGRIGIFNRSYYEEVLIARVRPEVLEAQQLPDEIARDKDIWHKRYDSINTFEKHLYLNGTRVIKFFLHLSKQEQRRRFLKRIDKPQKNWKFSLSDVAERRRWKQYMNAYEACLGATSTKIAPWHIIPADDKENARVIISQIIIDTLKDLKLAYPKLDAGRQRELRVMRRHLL